MLIQIMDQDVSYYRLKGFKVRIVKYTIISSKADVKDVRL